MALGTWRLQAQDTPSAFGVWFTAIDRGTALSEFRDLNKITESEILLHSGGIRLKIIDRN